jgi:hypothetical protein
MAIDLKDFFEPDPKGLGDPERQEQGWEILPRFQRHDGVPGHAYSIEPPSSCCNSGKALVRAFSNGIPG